MDMESALRARLLAAAPVTSIVGQRVYWEERPQGALLPAVVLDEITDMRPQTLKGFDMPAARVQVRSMATNFAGKKALREAVIAALVPPALIGGIQFMRAADEVLTVPRNERTETQFVYVDATSLMIRWKVVG